MLQCSLMRDTSAQSVPEPIHLLDPCSGKINKKPIINQFVPVVQVISRKKKKKRLSPPLQRAHTEHT